MFVASVPNGVIVQTWACPATTRVKAIFVPSGDQAGWKSVPSTVMLFGFVPSLFTTQRLPLLLKVICDPSGEKAGELPVVGVPGMVAKAPASRSKAMTLTCWELFTKVMRGPLGTRS